MIIPVTSKVSNLMFIKYNGPPIQEFKPKTYIKFWLEKHLSVNNIRQCGNKKLEEQHSKKEL